MRDKEFMKPFSDLVYKSSIILEDGTIETNALYKTELSPMWSDDTIKLYDEYIALQKQISKDKIHETKSAENTKIIMRVKEINAELKRRGYFR